MIVYKITNLINGKIYIGRTTKPLQKRWGVHCCHAIKNYKPNKSYIQRAIKKYGKENFIIEEIAKCNSLEELYNKEIDYIKLFNSINPRKGYNLLVDSTSGKGLTFLSEESRMKLGVSSHNKESYNKNGYKGVFFSNGDEHKSKPWGASIIFNKRKYVKRYADLKSAASAYDRLSIYLYGEDSLLNFPEDKLKYINEDLKSFFGSFKFPIRKSSEFLGVKLDKKTGKYMAQIRGSENIHLGEYEFPKEAAIVRDKIAYFLRKDRAKLNFPEQIKSISQKELKSLYDFFKKNVKQVNRKCSSKFRGVNKHKQSNIWCWELRHNGKRLRGTSKSEIDAAKKYDEHAKMLLGEKAKLNFNIYE